ncbi:organic cation transporter protein-like [Eriocheir sinensis]|uniref:organic cation transporter protein-like n=1 Tax=Eriocheir sinensis TaxID=95602 RepID=UPI0021CA353C|nr:organic cation transporter protein-like [Eriocheir sinensis]
MHVDQINRMETTLGRATDEGFHENLSEAKTDKDDPLAAATTFEDLMRVASPRGRWALRVVVLCALGNLPGPSSSMTYQLVGATPDHWCRVAPLLRANWTDQQIITFAIPTRNDSEHLEGCVMRDYRYEAAATLGYEATLANASLLLASNDTLACPTRSFNHSQHQHTFVTEWDLVCGRRYLYSSSQAAVYLGSLFGSLLASLVLNITGRRPAVIVSCVLNIALSFVLAAAPNITVYIILKGVIETLQCLIYIATFMIAMEVCAPSQRNYVGALFMLPWSVGCMLMPGIAYLVQPWRWLQAVYTALFLGTLAYIWVLPESPRWLIHSGRHGEALRLLRRAAIADGATLPPDDRLLAAMATIMRRERPRAAAACPAEPSRSCLRRAYRYLLALVLTPGLRPKAAVVFYLWTVAGTSYYGLSHNAKILSTDVYLHAFLVGLVEVPALLCLWPAITYLGRRKTLAFLLTVCGASVALMTLLMVIRQEVPDAVKLLLSLNSKMTMTASYHLIWVFTVELFSTTNRVRLLGEASLVTRVTTVTVPYINDLLGDVFPWAPGALCSLAALVAAGLVFLLPETTNRKITQQDDSRLDALEETSQRFIDA